MKTIIREFLFISFIVLFVSCKATFNATETMENMENRNAIYQEIISNPNQFNEFIDLANENENAKKILMQKHMQMMESGKMKAMIEKNPEMKQKMKSHMEEMMKKNTEMKEKMQSKMLDKIMESPEGRKLLIQKIEENKVLQKEMEEKMKDKHEG
jgi:hypothetical protein